MLDIATRVFWAPQNLMLVLVLGLPIFFDGSGVETKMLVVAVSVVVSIGYLSIVIDYTLEMFSIHWVVYQCSLPLIK